MFIILVKKRARIIDPADEIIGDQQIIQVPELDPGRVILCSR